MENAVRQRIKSILSANNISVTALSKAIQIVQTTLNGQLNQDRAISAIVIIKILDYFPNISPDWLLFGKGSMYRSEDKGGVSISQKAGAGSTQRASVGGSGEEYHELRIENAMLREQLKEEKARSDKYWSLIEKMSK